ncbi:MAG: sigma-54-dependent Fis family transcriptional regulator, partial [Deltaproteobacteria bacterium]|nr:sigma-54-dependent Fis family transcriptional regulator [Deltaproteobacteria bacterium]
MKKTSILLVDDDESLCTMLTMALQKAGFEIRNIMDGDSALETIGKDLFDVVITDLRIDEVSGFDILAKTKQAAPGTEVIMITGHGTVENAVEAMKNGAFDYIVKPVDTDELIMVVQKAAEHQRLVAEVKNLRSQVSGQNRLTNVIAVSQKMNKVIELVSRIADSTATILIEGESGTGKEVIARAIHGNSPRRS